MTDFQCDYYRMTGEKLSFSVKTMINILFHHNIRYMFWWRKCHKSWLSPIARIKCYRYSRKYGLEIGRDAIIGKGLYLGHPYNITIADGTIIGDNVNIHKGATIGRENRGKRSGTPIIGNQVYIGISSTIVGKIKIGTDVLIAPNAYVNFDVPDHSVVLGNPGRIINKAKATDNYVSFYVSDL